MLKTFAQSIVQDLVTAGSGILATHGYLAANQEQQFIGAAFFLIMLVVNGVMQHTQSNGANNAK
jgi:hypothetical protein